MSAENCERWVARARLTAALWVPGELQDGCSGHKCARGTRGAGPARSGLAPGSSRRAGQVCRSYIPPTEYNPALSKT